MKNIVFIILFISLAINSKAQDATLAYKVENYEFPYTSALKIKMHCEMADVTISKGNSSIVTIKCTYSAKHDDKTIATKELSHHAIRVKKTLNEIFISNLFTVSKGEQEPKAKLQVRFEIMLPSQVNLDIDNNFGSVRVENLSIRGRIIQDFGKLELKRTTANIELQGKLCDMQLFQTTGIVHCSNKSGDMLIDQFDGKELFIKNSNAQIKLNAIQVAVTLNLELSNCNLTCRNMNYTQRALDISSYKEPIKMVSPLSQESKNNYFTIFSKKAAPLFKVKADYTKITLN